MGRRRKRKAKRCEACKRKALARQVVRLGKLTLMVCNRCNVWAKQNGKVFLAALESAREKVAKVNKETDNPWGGGE